MKYEDNSSNVLKYYDNRLNDALELIGNYVLGEAQANIVRNFKRRTEGGGLLGSGSREVNTANKTVTVAFNTEYAAIQELGGDIVPRNAKALAIPVHSEAKKTAIPDGRSIRDMFPDLIYLPNKGGHPLLARKKGKGLEIMYVLVSKVHITAQPYLRPAVYNNTDQILRILHRAYQ